MTLPRHFTGENAGGDDVLRRSEPGEQDDTELYSPLKTSQANLIEFGIGVDLCECHFWVSRYCSPIRGFSLTHPTPHVDFQTCALICLMFFLAGVLKRPICS